MYEKIVVPLDSSKLAEVALPYAEELAAKLSSDIILITILESEEVQAYEKHQKYIKNICRATKYHAEKYLESTGGKAVKIETATRTGSPAQCIIEYTNKSGLPLIVMASHGRSGISRWAVGSVADKVVRSTSRQPVMLIRAKESRSDIREKRILKKALATLDGSRESQIVIPYISEIASKLQMELTLLQVVPQNNHTHADAEAYLQSKCNELEGKGINARYMVSSGAIADNIIDLANELVIDLVAMSTHGKTGVSLWPLGSVAEKVFLGGNTPLLLVRQ
jgi:nucleotide-binding universal stress UspA family protein